MICIILDVSCLYYLSPFVALIPCTDSFSLVPDILMVAFGKVFGDGGTHYDECQAECLKDADCISFNWRYDDRAQNQQNFAT